MGFGCKKDYCTRIPVLTPGYANGYYKAPTRQDYSITVLTILHTSSSSILTNSKTYIKIHPHPPSVPPPRLLGPFPCLFAEFGFFVLDGVWVFFVLPMGLGVFFERDLLTCCPCALTGEDGFPLG